MDKIISTIDDLEDRVGKASALVHLKSIDHLDAGALHWLASSSLMMASFGGDDGIGVTLGGGKPGWMSADSRQLHIPTSTVDDPHMARPGSGFGSFFVIPSTNELLRLNGWVVDNDGDTIRVAIEECYLHCGKALIRSEFWAIVPDTAPPAGADQLISAARFLAFGTVDDRGRADLSPKGDPSGAMVQVSDGTLWFADRPGNKRIDSFRNIVTQPKVAAVVIVPGSTYFVRLTGLARIFDDPDIRARFMVQGKIPELVTGINDLKVEFAESEAIARACIWSATEAPMGIEPAKIAIGHIKLNKSVEAQKAAEIMSAPGLVEKKMKQDYTDNLY
ncbi:pyridoxamine 5-phosphate oxidase-related FMN-binding protein [Rhizobium sp. CF080]|nr:pyridoxamine 5-phosphate oxidase-related FMN-binding protein [Rhizobium sp. CF080]